MRSPAKEDLDKGSPGLIVLTVVSTAAVVILLSEICTSQPHDEASRDETFLSVHIQVLHGALVADHVLIKPHEEGQCLILYMSSSNDLQSVITLS